MKHGVAAGLLLIARFRAEGLAAFDATRAGLVNALIPWLAFALVGFVLGLVADSARAALTNLFVSLVALLTPCVVSEALARLWGRREAWLRYAVAMVWSQWLMPPALLAAALAGGILVSSGVPPEAAEVVAAVALLGYVIALQVFLARRGLSLSRGRAVAMVAAINLGTLALVAGPILAGGDPGG